MLKTDQEKEYVKEEIRKEFQLERMVLFSDAVFAIVITLMAIEIRIPETVRFHSEEDLAHELKNLIPNILAYAISFLFIGLTWYQHLQVFSLLKDYNKGIVIRNLIMLFCIGLFPFSVTLVSRPSDGVILGVTIYFAIIFLCKLAQLALNHYILVKHPELRINSNVHEELVRYKKSRLSVILLAILFSLTITSFYIIKDPEMKPLAWCWFFLFPVVLRFLKKRIKQN